MYHQRHSKSTTIVQQITK